MEPDKLILRCFAERKGDYWQAFCIDLSLAVQGDSYDEVHRKLHEQISYYIHDALVGEDRAYAAQLLDRKSPLSIRMKYHWYRLLNHVHTTRDGVHRLFNEVMPLKPNCA